MNRSIPARSRAIPDSIGGGKVGGGSDVRGGPPAAGGDAYRIVDIVPFDPAWRARFERTRAEIAPVFPGAEIEHIGSTSVPGLSSKDTIDIAVGVPDVDQALSTAALAQLADLGFEYVPASFADNPDHAFCHRIVAEHRTDHVHVMRADSDTYRDRLIFRDYLRANPAAVQRYQRAKLDLAERFHDDRNAYVRRKEPVVDALMIEAYRWARTA